jgi:hypothetical protein
MPVRFRGERERYGYRNPWCSFSDRKNEEGTKDVSHTYVMVAVGIRIAEIECTMLQAVCLL